MEKAIIFDIDGVLLDTSFIFEEIFKLKLKGDDKWSYFIANCNSDRVKRIKGIIEFYQQFSNRGHAPFIFFSTARNEKCKEETLNKLWKEGFIIPDEGLFMRKDGDYRAATEVKKEHILEIMKNYKIVAFIDDDLANCEMAKKLGILSLRVV